MSDQAMRYVIGALAIVIAAGLAVAGDELPSEAWAVVGLLVGGGLVKRPGDAAGAAADELARELEADPATSPARGE